MNKPNFNTIWIQPEPPPDIDDPSHDLIYKRNNANLPSIKTGILNTCEVPLYSINVDLKGRVFLCACDGWLPFPVGMVTDFKTISEVFDSPQAKLIHESIEKKEYEYCDVRYCGINHGSKVAPDNIVDLKITFDTSCNFSCPSCRERLIFLKDKELLAEKIAWGKQIYQWASTTDKTVLVEFAGGEPFSSLVYSELIELYSELPNVLYVFRTNGSLVKTNQALVEKIKNKINQWIISIDAGTKEVYEKVRRGGKWSQLLENLEYLRTIPGTKTAIFVIQSDNLVDVLPFIELCNSFNLYPSFDLVQDWGTWHNFDEHCVHYADHPMHGMFVETVANIKKQYPRINTKKLEDWIK